MQAASLNNHRRPASCLTTAYREFAIRCRHSDIVNRHRKL
nr:MAG TPA: hypothetical protein [Caudoviricetes sp.]